MPKRIAICCDGTWNTPDELVGGVPVATNVTKLALNIKPSDASGTDQLMYYTKGVGTGRFDHWLGGAFGIGLSERIREAYMFIVENFELGDELFIFGFSRGAYTARSLGGFIRNSGVLKPKYAERLDAAYQLYRDRGNATHPRSTEAQLFRATYSIETRIKFIGVWDTVGSLGIPDLPVPATVGDYWKFHDVGLSTWVDNAYHALALDEHRKPFSPTLWSQLSDAPPQQVLQQIWFAGVHSDVGGGYAEAGLSEIALLWLASKAEGCGLALDRARLGDILHPDPFGVLHDSTTPLYAYLGDGTRQLPAVRLDPQAGQPMKTNESVASTAQRRFDADPAYQHINKNLQAYFARNGPITDVQTP